MGIGTRVICLNDQQSAFHHGNLTSYTRVEYGEGGPVRARFAEREAEELEELIGQLDEINFS